MFIYIYTYIRIYIYTYILPKMQGNGGTGATAAPMGGPRGSTCRDRHRHHHLHHPCVWCVASPPRVHLQPHLLLLTRHETSAWDLGRDLLVLVPDHVVLEEKTPTESPQILRSEFLRSNSRLGLPPPHSDNVLGENCDSDSDEI